MNLMIKISLALSFLLFSACTEVPGDVNNGGNTTPPDVRPPFTYDKVNEDDVRVLTYNIKYCCGRDKKVDLARVATVINELDADVVCLQEVDNGCDRSGRKNQAKELAKLTGMNYYFYGASYKFADVGYGPHGEFGNALLMNERPLSETVVHLPHENGGNLRRSASFVEFEKFVVVSAHLDLGENQRINSIPMINAQALSYDKPVIFTGDFNEGELEGLFFTEFNKTWKIVSALDKYTFKGSNGKTRLIDFICVLNNQFLEPVYGEIVHRVIGADAENASDHYPMFSDFSIDGGGATTPGTPSVERVWSYDTECGFQDASVALTPSGNIIFGEDAKPNGRGTKNMTVIDPAGKLVGSFFAPNVVRSTPAVADDGKYYFGSYGNMFYGFDANKPGNPRMSFTGEGHVKYNSPAVDKDGTIYSPQHGKLYSFTDNGGDTFTRNWEVSVGVDNIFTSPVLDANNVYIIPENETIIAYKKADGTEVWRKSIGGGNTSPAIGEDGTLYVAYNTDRGVCVDALNPADGTSKWSVPALIADKTVANAGVSLCENGCIYVPTYNSGSMNCLSQKDGSLVWAYATMNDKGIRSTAAIDNNGNVYFGDDGGYFYVLDSEGDNAYVPTQIGSRVYNSPAIAKDGTIYIGADLIGGSTSHEKESKIYAFKTTATGPMGGWSMMGGNAQRNGRGY